MQGSTVVDGHDRRYLRLTVTADRPVFRVLCVGIATLDIVNRVASYPREDSEVRASAQSRRMGGNAANTAAVLGQLGADVHWVGNLPENATLIERSFDRFRVDASQSVRVPDAVLPTSYITLSSANGSRTIVHFRDLPEYRAADFRMLDLAAFDWVHFEGRAVEELRAMLAHVAGRRGLQVSIEIEKPRPGIEALFPQAGLLMFSRAYAQARGFDDAESLLRSLPAGTAATCTWGERGAWAVDLDGSLWAEPAPAGIDVVDTIAAGDVFNAGMVHGLGSGLTLGEALYEAVKLASLQCTRDGLVLAD